MLDSYDLEDEWFKGCNGKVHEQLLQATLAIYTVQIQLPRADLWSVEENEKVMLWSVRQARDLMTTIRMNEADAKGHLGARKPPVSRRRPVKIPKRAVRGPFGGPPDPNSEPYD